MYTIMVVDDSTFIVDVFVTMLERGGYKTLSAYGGQECLDLLRTERPDLILLDIMMEPMDGRETLERIKTNPETKEIPVMMLTAKQLAPDEAQEYAIYVEDYVLKPITHRELYDVIEYILNRRARIRQDVEAARAAGVDQQVIDEYARISKSIEVNRRLMCILESTYNLSDARAQVGEEIARAIRSMNTNITFQEDRLHQIRSQMKVPLSTSGVRLSLSGPRLPRRFPQRSGSLRECRAPPERARAGFRGGAFARAPQVAVEPGGDGGRSCAPAHPGRIG